MPAFVSSLLLTLATAVMFAAAIRSSDGFFDYPVLVTAGALVCATLAAIPKLRNLSTVTGSINPSKNDEDVSAPIGMISAARIASFGVIWIGYVLLLPVLGFIASSSAALMLSLWISAGRLGIWTILGPILFVLILAVLVSVVLYVPVPKSALDYTIDEFVFAVMRSWR